MLHTETRHPISWSAPVEISLGIFVALMVFFAMLFNIPTATVSSSQPHLELSLSGAIGTKIVLTHEDVAKTLTCEDKKIQFALPAMGELYGLTWLFEMPERLDRAAVFTLGSTFPLRLSLTSQAGAYRTFTATEGELSFEPESKQGYFTAFLYDDNGERLFASASWQCE
jgi:hypothetical protein